MKPNNSNPGRLRGKVVVVTGASSGAGRAIALECAREGALLVLGARREEALSEVVAECAAQGARALAVPTDVTDAEAVQQLAEAAVEFGGAIDVWVNNAGVLAGGPFEGTPPSIHDQVIRTNLMGYLHGAHAALYYFKQQGYGTLINNISVGGWFPVPYAAGYSASKFGLRGLSEALRGELHAWRHIHVCDLFPAFLDTPGMQHAANYTSRVLKPAPPVYDPQKVARAAVSLAVSPKNSKTVGSVATLLRLGHLFFPGLCRRITATVIEGYLKKADLAPVTSGNLFEPLEYGTGVYGGWALMTRPAKKKLVATLAATLIGVGFLCLRKRL
ncbi:SDR family oxidoreductase [Paraflavisolibacter sp. H34]|uniref:SDR family oxidoreductase n=1 Tax=Huijunlia imazamoxiresistens TaxID=3127457 RepID=UPI00301646C9